MTTLASTTSERPSTIDRSLPRAWGAILIALLILTFAAVLTRASLDAGMPAVNIAALRVLIPWILMTPLTLLRHRTTLLMLKRQHILLACLAGFWFSVHFILLALALDYTKIIVVQTLINTIPLWAALLETTLLHTQLPRVVWMGLSLTILGTGLIAWFSWFNSAPTLILPPGSVAFGDNGASHDTLGAALSILGAITAATYMVIGRRVRAEVPLIPYVWVLFGSAALTGMIFIGITRTPLIGYDRMAYFWLILLALGPQLIAHSCLNYALAHLPATIVSLASQFITVTAPIVAFFAFAEVPTRVETIGSLIIACGVIIALTGRARSRR